MESLRYLQRKDQLLGWQQTKKSLLDWKQAKILASAVALKVWLLSTLKTGLLIQNTV